MFQIGCLTCRLALLGGSSLHSLAAGAVHGNRGGPVGRERKFHISKFTDWFLLSGPAMGYINLIEKVGFNRF